MTFSDICLSELLGLLWSNNVSFGEKTNWTDLPFWRKIDKLCAFDPDVYINADDKLELQRPGFSPLLGHSSRASVNHNLYILV